MKHFFVLGSNPALSTAEILSVLPDGGFETVDVDRQTLVVETAEALDSAKLMARLGGTIKIGHIIEEGLPVDGDALAELMFARLSERPTEGKLSFGYSVYSSAGQKSADKAFVRLRRAGMEAKRMLRESGRSCRWVRPQEGAALSSVTVDKNGLDRSGTEFVLLVDGDRMSVGLTGAVQPFEQFSQTDYGRPGRDARRGMLPPKLALMMVNLAGVTPESSLWDPFCGSGTVLTEALRLGVRRVRGSDLNSDAVSDTLKNVEWMAERGLVPPEAKIEIVEADARRPQNLNPKSVNAVVAETYLGPPRKGDESRQELQRRLDEVTGLCRESLAAWRPLLSDGAAVVLALPLYIAGPDRLGIDVDKIAGGLYETEPLLAGDLAKRLGTPLSPAGGLAYGRADQHVWREIIRLKLKA